MIDVLTEICNMIWRTGEWPTPWIQSLIITLPKKVNLQLCQNYRHFGIPLTAYQKTKFEKQNRLENKYSDIQNIS